MSGPKKLGPDQTKLVIVTYILVYYENKGGHPNEKGEMQAV